MVELAWTRANSALWGENRSFEFCTVYIPAKTPPDWNTFCNVTLFAFLFRSRGGVPVLLDDEEKEARLLERASRARAFKAMREEVVEKRREQDRLDRNAAKERQLQEAEELQVKSGNFASCFVNNNNNNLLIFTYVQNWHPQIAQANRGRWLHQNYYYYYKLQLRKIYNVYTK